MGNRTDRVEGYLSTRAQMIWKTAIVVQRADGEFVVRRPGEPDLGLGDSFHAAHGAVIALLRAHRAENT